MMQSARFFSTLLCLIAVGARADDATSGKAAERPDAKLQQLEADPARRARLLQDLRAFQNLPTHQQDRLRKLDMELHEASPAAAARLNRSLLRYVDWLEGLPAPKRNYIESASDPAERLRRIRQLRESDWIDRLPRAQREQVQAATGEARAALVRQFKQAEKERRQEWHTATRHWDELQKGPPPSRRSDLPQDTQMFTEKVLTPRMASADIERLQNAEGKWPYFMETLVELSDRHVPFPGHARPKNKGDLPEDLKKRIDNLQLARRTQIQSAEGRWPEYPQAILNALRRPKGTLTPRLTPSRPAEFEEPLQNFIRSNLVPQLNADEHRHLTNAEGAWPDYPKAVVFLAAKHNLRVPGMLPIPRNYAEKYRQRSSQ